MSEDGAAPDDADDRAKHARDIRGETPAQQADRNWQDILQELRVTQTGVQLLTAFLLSLPFQQRFTILDTAQKRLYLAVVLLSIGATGLLLMPVSVHRAVFRHEEKAALVTVANRTAQAGLALLALAVSGAVTLIFDIVENMLTGLIFGMATLLVLIVLWAAVPARIRRRSHGR
jgi:Family of unknown function (DUF6328)